jgi:hypothetical protein
MMTSTGPNSVEAGQIVIDDLTLSAWFDDELEPAEAERVQAAIDAQPQLQQQLARLLVNERRLREHYSAMAASQPLSDGLRDLLSEDPAAPRPWWLRLSDWRLPSLPRPALATAALAMALIVGVQLGGGPSGDVPEGLPSLEQMTQIDSSHPWFSLLESTPSGENIGLQGSQTGEVALSYRGAEGHWCRQFRVSSPVEGQALGAVACRDGGQWRIGLAQAIPLGREDDGLYRAASGDLSVIDTHILASMDGDVLMPSTESDLIQQGWP